MIKWFDRYVLGSLILALFKRNYGLVETDSLYYIEFDSKVKAILFLEKWIKTPFYRYNPNGRANAVYGNDGSVTLTISKERR